MCATKNYFTGDWSRKNLELLANYHNWQIGAKIDTKLETKELEKAILEHGNIGDTEARKLYENKNWLVYLSIDSGTEVVNHICKNEMAESEATEIN